jgi:iron complex transport system substrate-binding protein
LIEKGFSSYQFPKWDEPPKKVVSLVPSVTESLFELGFGESIVGITDYCTRPVQLLGGIPRVGGPKVPNLNLIEELNPDLVIANQEETERDKIEELTRRGIRVWLIFPKSVEDSMNMLRQFLALFQSDKYVMKVNSLQIAVDYARIASEEAAKTSYFCPIWYSQEEGMDWWMTFNQDTYPDDLLKLFGGENIFSTRVRLYPLAADLGMSKAEPALGRDLRYPRVSATEVVNSQPEVIFLPSEPYKFNEKDKEIILYTFSDTPAVRQSRIYFVDGSLLTWYGVRLAKALQTLPDFFFRI